MTSTISNGNLVTSNFLKVNGHTNGSTGVAYDGTDFYTSNIFWQQPERVGFIG